MSNRAKRSTEKGNLRAGQTHKHTQSLENKIVMKTGHLGHYATARDIDGRVRALRGGR